MAKTFHFWQTASKRLNSAKKNWTMATLEKHGKNEFNKKGLFASLQRESK
jgi:hypothetical protein